MSRKHLLTIIPSATGMGAHIAVLLQRMREYRAHRCREDDVYTWWGIRRPSQDQVSPPQREAILALPTEKNRNDPEPETHLYLTDYHNLYVAHLGTITADNPLTAKSERSRVPTGYYRPHHRQWLKCDLWFRLWDIRRLVNSDIEMVDHELRQLRDERTNQPVSIFEGIANLPLIVTRERGPRYFDTSFRKRFANGRHWIEFQSEHTGMATIERELRENLFGDAVWRGFSPSERLFIATAERLFRDNTGEPMFDLGSILSEYSKVLEVRCMRVLREALSCSGTMCKARRGTVLVDIHSDDGYLGLGDLARFIEDAASQQCTEKRQVVHARTANDSPRAG